MLLLSIGMKNFARALVPFTIFAAIFVSSCSDAGLLLPVERNAAGIEIMSVTEGAILSPAGSFEVALRYDEDEVLPDGMLIELIDEAGNVLFSVELTQEEILQLPLPVLLPEDLEDGIYTVLVTVFQEESETASDRSVFFYTTEVYEIESIAAYPQIFYPGGSGLVLADLDVPEGADPYLRWSLSGEVVKSDLLSNGADTLQLDVPEREGVISILLEVFPFGPAAESEEDTASDGSAFAFPSFISLEAQFFVSSTQEVDEFELGPEEYYYSLFHFRGETVDWGYHGNGDSAEAIGFPTLAIGGSSFGYLLDGSSGFVVDEALLPFGRTEEPASDAAGGPLVLEAFSFSARFVLLTAKGSLFRVEDSSGRTLFSVNFDADGQLAAAIGSAVSAPVQAALPDGYNELTLTIIPGDASIRVLWFVNGELVADEVTAYEPVEDPGAGTTYIGGLNGIHAIIDEIGIYHRVTDDGHLVDAEVFTRAMERLFGNDLVLAEGFDGTHLPEYIVYDTSAGEYVIGGGSLILPPGGSVQFDAVPDYFETLSITIESADDESTFGDSSGDGDSDPIGEDDGDDTNPDTRPGVLVLVTEDGEEIAIGLGEDTVTSVTLFYGEDGFSLSIGEDTSSIDPVGRSITIRNQSAAGGFELRSVLIVKNQFEE